MTELVCGSCWHETLHDNYSVGCPHFPPCRKRLALIIIYEEESLGSPPHASLHRWRVCRSEIFGFSSDILLEVTKMDKKEHNDINKQPAAFGHTTAHGFHRSPKYSPAGRGGNGEDDCRRWSHLQSENRTDDEAKERKCLCTCFPHACCGWRVIANSYPTCNVKNGWDAVVWISLFPFRTFLNPAERSCSAVHVRSVIRCWHEEIRQSVLCVSRGVPMTPPE